MFNPLEVIVRLSAAVALWAGVSESVTLTVKEKVPQAVGVPESTPAVESDKPVGNAPLTNVQE
jgi:hypothetical protein